MIFQMADIDSEFATTDVALVIGANDVVNPSAISDKSSPLFGVPILDAQKAAHVYVVKRGQGKGYAGVVNPLFYSPNCEMVRAACAIRISTLRAAIGRSNPRCRSFRVTKVSGSPSRSVRMLRT